MAEIPDAVWQRVVRYIGMEQNLLTLKQSRDWRFEKARAAINRAWKAARSCILTGSWPSYVAKLVLLRAHIRMARHGHITDSLVHRTLMAELRLKFKKESIDDRKKIKALQCLRFLEYLSKHSSKFLMSPSRTFFDLRRMRANQFYLR